METDASLASTCLHEDNTPRPAHARRRLSFFFCYNHSMTLFPIPARRRGPELLDLPDAPRDYAEVAESLADIRTVNRYLGGLRSAGLDFLALVDSLPDKGKSGITVLDAATGSADVPAEIVRLARSRNIPISLTAVDISPAVIRAAREHTGEKYPEIQFIKADALGLPFEPGSFDFAFCNLAMHHFDRPDAVRLIRSIASVSRSGFVIADLRRNWAAWFLITVLTRMFTGNRLTRYDGPQSVLRSYLPDEFRDMAAQAGLTHYKITSRKFWRMSLVGMKGGGG
jgi:ubiquinone/menaquinone biosynthesis C-methylase UbiE